jgi:hypothetical protein
MLRRELVIGRRIANILGDSTLSDGDFNFIDFVYVLDNDIAIRIPYDDESGDLLPQATVTPKHTRLVWPKDNPEHFKKNLWNATITDILLPHDPEERYPDRGIIKLSSGWYLTQLSGAPAGIAAAVYLQEEISPDPLISVWETEHMSVNPDSGQ